MGCRCVTVREEFATRMSSPSKIRSSVRRSGSGTPKVIAFGNVLLDATVQLNDLEILKRYKLSLDAKGEIDIQTLTKISEEICGSLMAPVNCGGSALNTTRILKQLGTDCLFFGAVGGDPLADLLKGILKKTGVHASLEVIPDDSTGQCVCFVYGRKNALYANVGASSKFSLEYLKHAEIQEKLLHKSKKRQIFYLEGFFLPQKTDVVRHIVRNYIGERKILVLNLSAPYIIEENFDIMTFLVHSAHVVFGNRDEFTTLSKKCGFRSIEEFSKQELTQKPSTVFVITNDKQNVLLIRNNGTREAPMVEFDSFAVPMVKVVDSTGAGDSFVAGFLHSYLKGCPLTKCIQHAIAVASLVVQQVGCNLP
ncbi:adenosine kinase [Eupeodes corollae]|uniref:adenosine kinase n=1 Tax=Eupeodes corollae TaxID=290404 RepID=UPI002493929A|nr:adenosine kinase [Eupeodes corollae]